jgi:hypothetical protein
MSHAGIIAQLRLVADGLEQSLADVSIRAITRQREQMVTAIVAVRQAAADLDRADRDSSGCAFWKDRPS